MSDPMFRKWLKNQEQGQIMIGFYVGIMIVMGIMIIVSTYFINVRKSAASRQLKDMAIQVAYEGFQEGLSYFQRQPSGVYLPPSICPANDFFPATGTVESYPDDAFRPLSGDTDIYVPVSQGSGGLCSAAIIHDFPLMVSHTVATDNLPYHGGIWGRFVIKRQTVRNWTPGPNTANANTDSEAAHDITMQREYQNPGAIGSGLWWSITSRGYVYLGSGTTNPNISDDISVAASTVANSLTSSPLATYNNRTLLLATAKVYGELYRVNISSPDVALFLTATASLSGNSSGVIWGGTGTGDYDMESTDSAPWSGPTLQSPNYQNIPAVSAPSVSSVFPGLSILQLQATAGSSFTGDVNVLPNTADVTFSSEVSQTEFYFLQRAGSPNTTFTFTPAAQGANCASPSCSAGMTSNTFQGTGLVFVYGNLSITAGTIANWDGIVFVDGNAYINGPANIYGQLICTGLVYVAGGNYKANIQYDQSAVTTTEQLIQNFQPSKASVVTSYN
jgi:hypothetical protein